MQVIECSEDLLHYEGSNVLRQKLLVDDVMEQFSTFAILKNEETDFVPFPDFVEFDDVGMVLYKRLRQLC